MVGKEDSVHTLKGLYCLFQLQGPEGVDNVLFCFLSPIRPPLEGEFMSAMISTRKELYLPANDIYFPSWLETAEFSY